MKEKRGTKLNETGRARFWRKVKVGEDCWEWTAATSAGYGLFWTGYNLAYSHRVAYAMEHGEIPEGLVIDHLCKNTKCVRPSHLEAVTNRTNLVRGSGFASAAYRKACNRGHEYLGNEVVRRGGRVCKVCETASRREWRKKEKERGFTKRVPPPSCRNGHPYTPDNTYTDALGKFYCRECHAVRQAARRATLKMKKESE